MDWLRLNTEGEIEFVSEEVKLVPELQTLLALKYNKGPKDNDGRKRFKALAELKYLYLVYSPKSPYKDYSDHERLEEAKKDCLFPNEWEESTELKLLVPKFIKGNTSKISRMLQTAEGVLDKLDSYLRNIDFTEKLESGVLLHKPKEVIDTLKQLPSLAANLQELEQQVRQGHVGTPKSKGDHEVGWMALNGDNKPKQREDED
jgi:hypothetical protein